MVVGWDLPITKRKVRRHLKSKWIKLQHKNVGVPENLKNKEKQQVVISTKNIDAKQLQNILLIKMIKPWFIWKNSMILMLLSKQRMQ